MKVFVKNWCHALLWVASLGWPVWVMMFDGKELQGFLDNSDLLGCCVWLRVSDCCRFGGDNAVRLGDGFQVGEMILLPYWVWYKVLHWVMVVTHSLAHNLCILFWFILLQLIYPYPSGLLHWCCDNHMIAPVPVKPPWEIWVNLTSIKMQQKLIKCVWFKGCTVNIRLPW